MKKLITNVIAALWPPLFWAGAEKNDKYSGGFGGMSAFNQGVTTGLN